MTQLLLALQFLTILPIRVRQVKESDLAGSMAFYPLVGALLGLLSAGVYLIVRKWTGETPAVVSAAVALIFFSGALHMEGFADLCDGFYAGKDKKQTLSIMKDSHAGSMAVIGVACLLALKCAFLAAVPEPARVPALITAPLLARWSMVFLSTVSVYARRESGTGSPYIGKIKAPVIVAAALFTLLIGWLTFPGIGLVFFAVVTAFAWVFRLWIYRRIGGMTGDTLGACGELTELLVCVLFSLYPVWVPS